VVRSASLTALALMLAFVTMALVWDGFDVPPLLTPVLVGVGLAAALSGALRTAGQGPRRIWVGVGMVTGLLTIVVLGMVP
jgi:hypothetical protein